MGVIDVGGGLRGAFGSGVFDYCLDRGIHFDYEIGVSAGSANLVAYRAGEFGRNYKFYTEYSLRSEYMSVRNFLKTRSYVNLDYVYGELLKECPLDFEAMISDPAEFIIVATDAETGAPVYFTKRDLSEGNYAPICASSCVPGINQPYLVNGKPYYDGGISDPIPFQYAFDAGCDRLVVVLTRPKDMHRTGRKDARFARIVERSDPAAARTLAARAETYNRELDAILDLERSGRVLIVAPDDIGGMKTLTRDMEMVKALYRKGLVAAQAIDDFVK